jgi:hypothetical protein
MIDFAVGFPPFWIPTSSYMKMTFLWAHNAAIALRQSLHTVKAISLSVTFLGHLRTMRAADFTVEAQRQRFTYQFIQRKQLIIQAQ